MPPKNADQAYVPPPYRVSQFWDICVPVTIASVPAVFFFLHGLLDDGMDKPGAEPSRGAIILRMALFIPGFLGMVLVGLARLDHGTKQLSIRTNGNPPVWRKLALMFSLFWILLFDVSSNLATTLTGAGPLFILSAPAFIAYLACIRVAFHKL